MSVQRHYADGACHVVGCPRTKSPNVPGVGSDGCFFPAMSRADRLFLPVILDGSQSGCDQVMVAALRHVQRLSHDRLLTRRVHAERRAVVGYVDDGLEGAPVCLGLCRRAVVVGRQPRPRKRVPQKSRAGFVSEQTAEADQPSRHGGLLQKETCHEISDGLRRLRVRPNVVTRRQLGHGVPHVATVHVYHRGDHELPFHRGTATSRGRWAHMGGGCRQRAGGGNRRAAGTGGLARRAHGRSGRGRLTGTEAPQARCTTRSQTPSGRRSGGGAWRSGRGRWTGTKAPRARCTTRSQTPSGGRSGGGACRWRRSREGGWCVARGGENPNWKTRRGGLLGEKVHGAPGGLAQSRRLGVPGVSPRHASGRARHGDVAALLGMKGNKTPTQRDSRTVPRPRPPERPPLPHANGDARRDKPKQAGPRPKQLTRVYAGAVLRRGGVGKGAGAAGGGRGRL